MEHELNKLIEQQNREYDLETHELDDDLQSNCDIDDFEQRLKAKKNKFFDDSDSDDDVRPSKTNAKKQSMAYQPPKQSRPLLSEEPDLFRQVQQMHQNKSKETMQSTKKSGSMTDMMKTKQEVQQRAEDDKLLDILNSNNTGLKDKKLKELIQKNKELYVNLEKEKTMRQKLQKDIEKIKAETDMQLNAMGVKMPKGDNANKSEDSTDWKKKYIELEKRLQETKLQNTTLKNDLNKAMRVITKEIGDNVNIDAVLAEENSWKGRAQQIEVLKARVKELQAKTASAKEFSDISYITDRNQSEMGMSSGKTFNMGGKAKDRREELESLKVQYESLKAENDALTDKIKALTSRKTVLEKENKEMKNEFERTKQILKEKSDNDDRYIAALKKEVEKLKDKSPGLQTRIVYRDKPSETKRTENEDIDGNLAKKELFVLKNELDKKEKIIKDLISDKLRNTTNNINKENVIQENITDQEKMLKLETMIKLLKQENEELSNMKLGLKAATPDSKLIKDLSLQNAQLRRKVDDLQQKLKALQ